MQMNQAPTLEDAFVAGLPLRVGVKLEAVIEANPSEAPDVWWELLAMLRDRAAQQSLPSAAAPA